MGDVNKVEQRPIPITTFNGFLGAGKTTTILGLLEQLPKDYKVVLLKNEYGDVEVDSLLAKQGNITGVSEILNGCLCCTMVGRIENTLEEIRDKFNPDRIIIESSGSAFPATLALQIRKLEPEGFKLDGVVTVIDCKNFKGYEDTSPSAKLQAKYTDLHLLSKHEQCTEREFDILLDHLGELTDQTPYIKVSRDKPIRPEVLFGLDTQLFKLEDEKDTWEALGGAGKHMDEVETRSVWRGGQQPGSHEHANGDRCASCPKGEKVEGDGGTLTREKLDNALKLPAEIYRVKGIVRFPADSAKRLANGEAKTSGHETYILNWAFGSYDLTRAPGLDDAEDLDGVACRLTVMGERGEVNRRARKISEILGAQYA